MENQKNQNQKKSKSKIRKIIADMEREDRASRHEFSDLFEFRLDEIGESEFYKLDKIAANKQRLDNCISAIKSYKGIDSYLDYIIDHSVYSGYPTWAEGVIRKYWSNIRDVIEIKSLDDLVIKIVKNIYILRFDYFGFILEYIKLYKSSKLLRLVLRRLDCWRVDATFEDCCRLQKDVIRLDNFDQEQAALYACLRICSYDWFDLHTIDFDELIKEIRKTAYYKNPILFSIYNSIIFTLKERYMNESFYIRSDVYTILTDKQIEKIGTDLNGLLFDESTSTGQLISMLHGRFDEFGINRLKLKEDATLRMFKYFIDGLLKKGFIHGTGFYSSLDSFKWLEHKEKILTAKKFKDAQPRESFKKPKNTDKIDEVIEFFEKKNGRTHF